AGGASGGADFSDQISARDARAVFESFGDAGEVGVVGFEAAAVADGDEVSVGALPAGVGDDAIGHGLDGCAGGCAVIDALVLARTAQDRVRAAAKAAGDAGKGQRASKELALE